MEADVETVESASAILASMQPISVCSEVERLRAGVAPPPPDKRDEVAELRAELTALAVRGPGAGHREALASARALVERARGN